jgi:tryptophan 2,3-dioxygenase
MPSNTSPEQILTRLEQWEKAQLPIAATSDAEALDALHGKGMGDDEINQKLDRLTVGGERATPRMLASYTDLHAVNRIHEASNGADLSANPKAGNIRAVLQAAEIALLNTRDLSQRITQDVDAGKLGEAEEKYRWVSSLQHTLQSLSLLANKLNLSGKGAHTCIADSPSTAPALDELKQLHRSLAKAGLVDETHISDHDIHESGRNLSHQAFVDTTYVDVWNNSLRDINIPGAQLGAGEDGKAFYKRFVGTDALNLAVNELNQTGDNFLRQFRAYHQMSEILVGQANRLISDSIRLVLQPGGNLMQANENMRTALDMLELMNQNVLPILRNLSVNKYQDIRGSLGITSGSHSPHIKHGLFQPLYELFVDAVKLRVMNLQPHSEAELSTRAAQLAENPTSDHATHDQYQLLQNAHELHLALRSWRDLHMQFVKTQLGMPPMGNSHGAAKLQPTASISGAPHAMRAAHSMRQGAHGEKDVIVPVYQALLGKEFPAVSPFETLFRRDGAQDNLVDSMLGETAKVVARRSANVQDRVHGH